MYSIVCWPLSNRNRQSLLWMRACDGGSVWARTDRGEDHMFCVLSGAHDPRTQIISLSVHGVCVCVNYTEGGTIHRDIEPLETRVWSIVTNVLCGFRMAHLSIYLICGDCNEFRLGEAERLLRTVRQVCRVGCLDDVNAWRVLVHAGQNHLRTENETARLGREYI